MKLIFKQNCSCKDAILPTPSLHTQAPSLDDPQTIVDISFKCSICGEPWTPGIAISEKHSRQFPRVADFLKSIQHNDKDLGE
jgi:hypothetical protein